MMLSGLLEIALSNNQAFSRILSGCRSSTTYTAFWFSFLLSPLFLFILFFLSWFKPILSFYISIFISLGLWCIGVLWARMEYGEVRKKPHPYTYGELTIFLRGFHTLYQVCSPYTVPSTVPCSYFVEEAEGIKEYYQSVEGGHVISQVSTESKIMHKPKTIKDIYWHLLSVSQSSSIRASETYLASA